MRSAEKAYLWDVLGMGQSVDIKHPHLETQGVTGKDRTLVTSSDPDVQVACAFLTRVSL